MRETRQGGIGDDVERAMRTYEAEVAEAGAFGRHVDPDGLPAHLEALRTQVITRAEALPSICWPRPKCEHCQGKREVSTVQVLTETGQPPQFVTHKRLCPTCWGTGLTTSPRPTQGTPEGPDQVGH